MHSYGFFLYGMDNSVFLFLKDVIPLFKDIAEVIESDKILQQSLRRSRT